MATTMEITRVAIREGLLTENLNDLAAVRLVGTKCRDCGETSLGANALCPNCGGDAVTAVPLADHGTLWTYTVVRNPPPGDYKGPRPFAPFGLGLVEMPDGIRVYAPLEADVGRLEIGMALGFRAFVQHRDAEDREVVAFAFTAN
jgi:uncharacterized OB-fold protein